MPLCWPCLDVSPEHVLDVLLLEAALEDELVVAVDGRARRAQLGRQEGQQVLRLSVKAAVSLNYSDSRILGVQSV